MAWLLLVVLFISSSLSSAVINKEDVELKLLDHLFGKFDNRVRPVQQKTDPVKVVFGLAYVQLVDLSEKDQMLISNVWIRQTWNNTFLTWNPAEFGNITTINVDPTKVWLPDIMLYNSAKAGNDAGTMYKFKTKVILSHTGLAKWFAPAIIRSGCSIDITYFPFDDQLCEMTFGSWAFTGQELDLVPDSSTADLVEYLKDAELDLVSANAYRKVIKYSCCPATYPNVIFLFHLRRQPGFFLYNVIIPSLVMTCFAVLTFTSPHATGERVGLSIESFLSLSFVCLMVAESIPVISDVTPLITKFLLTCMCMISLAVVFNLISLNLLCTTPVPSWLKYFMFHVLGPCIGVSAGKKLEQTRAAQSVSRQPSKLNNDVQKIDEYEEDVETALLDPLHVIRRLSRHRAGEPPSRYNPHSTPKLKKRPRRIMATSEMINSEMHAIVRKSDTELATRDSKDFWRCMAQTVDRLFLLGFLLSFISVSTFMLLKGFRHHIRQV